MEKCPKCGKWTLSYDSVREEKVCMNRECGHREYYCKNRHFIEGDSLHKIVGGVRKNRKCLTPKGWRECDTCELRA